MLPTCSLREGRNVILPGQIFDGQAGLHANGLRDYDPAVGRYVESDPLGLRAGINTYAYAAGTPMLNIDPSGLDVTVGYFPGGTGHVGIGVNSRSVSGLYPDPTAVKYSRLLTCRGVKGIVLTNGYEKAAKYLVIHTTAAQDAQIQNYVDTALNNNTIYNLCSNQCTNFVRNALEAGGVSIPPGASFDPIPETFFNALRWAYGSWTVPGNQ